MRKLIAVAAFVLMMVPALAQNHTDYKLPDEPKRAKYVDFPSQDKGLWFAVQVTPALGNGFFAQADLIAGFRAGEFFRVGAGVSPQFGAADPVSGANGFSLPVYLDLRGNIISQESRMAVPYWNLDAGYSFMHNTGLYLSPTVGVRVGMPRNDFIAGLTYMLFEPKGAGFTPIHAVGLRLGYEF
ncbi:MAG: hypothetical protein IK031_03750 [Bacteroidales bacterium]|nr:hypothetical protein [Bacteroidales bacterium]